MVLFGGGFHVGWLWVSLWWWWVYCSGRFALIFFFFLGFLVWVLLEDFSFVAMRLVEFWYGFL